jgi:hypothetical protein
MTSKYKFIKWNRNTVAKHATIMFRIREVLDSNRGPKTEVCLLFSSVHPSKYWSPFLQLHSFESASELYRSSDRRRSAKLVPTLADRGCHVVSATSPSDRNFYFLDLEPLQFLPSISSNCSRGWVDPVPDPPLLRKILQRQESNPGPLC